MLLSLEQYQQHHVKKNDDIKYIQILQTRILAVSRA